MKEKFNELNPTAKVTIVLVIFFLALAVFILLNVEKKETKTYSASSFSKVNSDKLNDFDTYLVVENHLNRFFGVNDNAYLYHSLDRSYIDEYGVTEGNVLEKLGFENKNLLIKVNKIYKLSINDIEGYYAEGILYNDNEVLDSENASELINIIDKKYGIFLFIDYDNLSFSVYPNISQSDTIKMLNNKDDFTIERNEYNKMVKSAYSTKLELCKHYYSDLVFKINYTPDELYNYLDNSDKNHFKNKKEFKEYLDKFYKDYVYSFKSCDQGTSSKDYYLNDENNTFKIKIYGLMNYTVDLP